MRGQWDNTESRHFRQNFKWKLFCQYNILSWTPIKAIWFPEHKMFDTCIRFGPLGLSYNYLSKVSSRLTKLWGVRWILYFEETFKQNINRGHTVSTHSVRILQDAPEAVSVEFEFTLLPYCSDLFKKNTVVRKKRYSYSSSFHTNIYLFTRHFNYCVS